jgi:GNAT superfamily N-acetyltransferase
MAKKNDNMLHIVIAKGREHYTSAAALFKKYADSLEFDLEFQRFDEELASLEEMYSPPAGCLLLAEYSGKIAGCVGLRRFEEGVCEMKRMYVLPEFRGKKIGRELAVRVVEEARKFGYERMRLDTIASMKEADALYRSLGFHPIDAYRYNPIDGAAYYELVL